MPEEKLYTDKMMQIGAILSDYDGTLCPAASVRGNGGSKIPPKLEKILWDISKEIPICIVSSKDFFFLHDKTKFAKVVSCMMGIETLVLKKHHYSKSLSGKKKKIDYDKTSITDLQDNDDNFQCIAARHILSDKQTLQNNSGLLCDIVNEIVLNFKDISVEQKFTTDKEILAGVTFDYRHIVEDWQAYKRNTEPLLKQAILQKIMLQQQQYKAYPINEKDKEHQQLHIQTYTAHPFIDVYNIKSDKALAYDIAFSQLASLHDGNVMTKKVLYLGDSENDNPAFRKADVSIGIRSDKRVNPKLDSKYIIQYSELAAFLEQLQNNEFVFSKL